MKRLLLLASLLLSSARMQALALYPMENGDLRRSGQAQSLSHVVAPLDVVWSSYLCPGGDVQSNPVVLADRVVQTFDYSTVCVSRFDGRVIWKTGCLGHQWNAPAYDADRDLLYISSWSGSMQALRASDGVQVWQYYEGNSKGCWNLGACTYWQDKIYVGTGTGRLVCLDADTQSILWTLSVGTTATGIGTPAIDNGELYVCTLAGKCYRLDANTGAVIWQTDSPGTCFSSAVSLDDTQLYVMTNGGKVVCRSRATGAQQWSFQTGSWTMSNISVGPQGLYCTSDDRNIYRLDPATGAVIWNRGFSGNFARSAPFCHGDMVVASGCTGVFYGQDSGDGSDAWFFNHGGGNDFTGFAQADGLLFVTTLGGMMYCLHPQNAPFPPTVTASPSKTVTMTPTSTVTRTISPTSSATNTPSATPSSSSTSTPTHTPSVTPTITPSSTRTSTPSATSSVTPTGSPSITLTGSATPSVTMTYTHTTVPTATPQERDGEGLKDPGDDDIYAGPNPVHGGPCKVVYRMRGPGTCRVRIFQASGDPVGLVEQRHETAGVHSCQVSTQRYAPGVYFYRADRQYDDGQSDKLPLKKLLVLKAR